MFKTGLFKTVSDKIERQFPHDTSKRVSLPNAAPAAHNIEFNEHIDLIELNSLLVVG